MSCEFIERKGDMMKKILAFLLTICMVFSLTACTGTPTGDGDTTGENSGNQTENTEPEINEFEGEDYVIEFVDKEIEDAVREQLALQSGGDVMASRAAQVNSLYLDMPTSLDDLKHLQNLESLTFYAYEDDFDYTVLKEVTSLTSIAIKSRTEIAVDISFLSELTNLKHLEISAVDIADISFLSTSESLESLRLSVENLTDISEVAKIPNLTELTLTLNEIDISQVSGLTQLTHLGLYAGDEAIEIGFLRDFENLTSLIVGFNATDISVFGELTNLTKLEYAYGDTLSNDDAGFLANLTNLTYLIIGISDLTPISGLTNLTHLTCIGTGVTDISPLSGLTELTHLNLKRNLISDITPLSNLTKLERLSLGDNQISDLTPLSNLTTLISLYIEDNPITDWSPVAHMEGVGGRPDDDTEQPPTASIFAGEPYIGRWKAPDRELYLTLNDDGTFEINAFGLDEKTGELYLYPDETGTQTGTFAPSPPMLFMTYDDGENYIFIYDPGTETLTNDAGTIAYEWFEGELPEPITAEEHAQQMKEFMVGTWTSDTTDSTFTFNEDDTFTLENQADGNFDSGTFSLEPGYRVDFEGEKYTYYYFSFENDSFSLYVGESTEDGVITIISESHIFALED